MTSLLHQLSIGVCISLLTSVSHAGNNEIVRYKNGNTSIPVAAAVEVPRTVSTVYLSGKLPPVQDPSYSLDNPLAYGGNTRDQTIRVLGAIEKSLHEIGLGLGDIVKLQVFLVGDPTMKNEMDMRGFMEGYVQFFGTQVQPNLPARSVLNIAGLANRGSLVEIDAIAVRREKNVHVEK